MKDLNRQVGMHAEDLAVQKLSKKGYHILERNFSNRFGEIDIIAKDKDTLVFVEVKAKKGVAYGLPEEMITPGKLKRIQNMATVYMNGKLLPCRVDVVAIVFSPDGIVESLMHYENVQM